jgi:hypothetical protein
MKKLIQREENIQIKLSQDVLLTGLQLLILSVVLFKVILRNKK